jgi:hypothetical protein
MSEYRPSSGVYLITRAEIARLHEPQNKALREQVEESMCLLHGLFSRYGSDGHRWFDLDEDQALRELQARIDALRNHDPYWRRILEDVDRYLRMRDEHSRTGPSLAKIEVADDVSDAVLDRLAFLEGYPRLMQVQAKLAELAGAKS